MRVGPLAYCMPLPTRRRWRQCSLKRPSPGSWMRLARPRLTSASRCWKSPLSCRTCTPRPPGRGRPPRRMPMSRCICILLRSCAVATVVCWSSMAAAAVPWSAPYRCRPRPTCFRLRRSLCRNTTYVCFQAYPDASGAQPGAVQPDCAGRGRAALSRALLKRAQKKERLLFGLLRRVPDAFGRVLTAGPRKRRRKRLRT